MSRCERKGHKYRTQVQRGYTMKCHGWGFRCVADAVTQERQRCRRCRETTKWLTVYHNCLNSLSMDSLSWEVLRRDGALGITEDTK